MYIDNYSIYCVYCLFLYARTVDFNISSNTILLKLSVNNVLILKKTKNELSGQGFKKYKYWNFSNFVENCSDRFVFFWKFAALKFKIGSQSQNDLLLFCYYHIPHCSLFSWDWLTCSLHNVIYIGCAIPKKIILDLILDKCIALYSISVSYTPCSTVLNLDSVYHSR